MPRVFEIEDQVADLARARGIDPGGRFIEHQQPGFLDERLREADALEHALRVAAEAAVARVFEPDQLQEFPGAVAQLGAAEPADFAVEEERFLAGEDICRNKGSPAGSRRPRGSPPSGCRARKSPCVPVVGEHQAEHDLHGGAFAGAVRAEQAVNLAGLDVEREVPDGDHALPLEGDRDRLW